MTFVNSFVVISERGFVLHFDWFSLEICIRRRPLLVNTEMPPPGIVQTLQLKSVSSRKNSKYFVVWQNWLRLVISQENLAGVVGLELVGLAIREKKAQGLICCLIYRLAGK